MKKYPSQIKDVVTKILTDFPETRDSDEVLYEKYIYQEGNLYEFSAIKMLFRKVSKGELASFDTISRARRQLQQYNKDLRGEKYEYRKKRETKIVQEDLGYE